MGEALASGWRGGVGLAYRWGRDVVGSAGEWVVWVWVLVDGDELSWWFFILGTCDGLETVPNRFTFEASSVKI